MDKIEINNCTKYYILNIGNVINYRKQKIKVTGKIGEEGIVRIKNDKGKEEIHIISELVLLHFVGPKPFPESIPVHINGDYEDRRAENLEWSTNVPKGKEEYESEEEKEEEEEEEEEEKKEKIQKVEPGKEMEEVEQQKELGNEKGKEMKAREEYRKCAEYFAKHKSKMPPPHEPIYREFEPDMENYDFSDSYIENNVVWKRYKMLNGDLHEFIEINVDGIIRNKETKALINICKHNKDKRDIYIEGYNKNKKFITLSIWLLQHF